MDTRLILLRMAAGETGDVPEMNEEQEPIEVARLTILAVAREAKRREDLSSFASWFDGCWSNVSNDLHAVVASVRAIIAEFKRGIIDVSEAFKRITFVIAQ